MSTRAARQAKFRADGGRRITVRLTEREHKWLQELQQARMHDSMRDAVAEAIIDAYELWVSYDHPAARENLRLGRELGSVRNERARLRHKLLQAGRYFRKNGINPRTVWPSWPKGDPA
jgi:hypothetical protein